MNNSEFSVFGYNRIGHSPEEDPPFGATTCHHIILIFTYFYVNLIGKFFISLNSALEIWCTDVYCI